MVKYYETCDTLLHTWLQQRTRTSARSHLDPVDSMTHDSSGGLYGGVGNVDMERDLIDPDDGVCYIQGNLPVLLTDGLEKRPQRII